MYQNSKTVFCSDEPELEFSARFSVNFQFRAEVKKVTSRAENPLARAMARASSARAHH
jgi:hypothetical protein